MSAASGSSGTGEHLTPNQKLPDRPAPDLQLHELGGLVVAAITSTAGRGLHVYRVLDGKVAECWAINADGRDSTDGF